ncbi:ATP-binding cassette domain-containing protein [Comamonas sp. NLF-1-9]|uniref:ATP-binding cassette domain-containing protein n=1 Tax=Comamonas sp. NLF-1-9 TaxID=2853163 RepID=UPI001C45ADA1|nr:ATP-binding cassette domain-containing protein [Comamonas sp. NLF-1-9]QXL85297.1 ATP-binding cassette domain-containing protein [Comamonas sp. NLF-1-9]
MPEAATATPGKPSDEHTSVLFAQLWRAVWRYRWRTFAAVVLLVLAKVAAVGVPLVFKRIIDLFSMPGGLSADLLPGASSVAPAGGQVLMLPVLLLAGYAALRFASTLFTELRDLCFARVTLVTVADFARRALAHMHAMGPRFHLQFQTGALMRDVERGTNGVGFLLGALLFTLLPTLVEILAVVTILALGYSLWFTAIIVATFVLYASYTTVMTRRRVLVQRQVNALDSRASGLMLDSLVNQESVRNNACETQEVRRYGEARQAWVEQSVDNQKALSALHLGQGAIIAFGVGAIMLFAGREALRGSITVGDLVLLNSYVIQICLPLNALGFLFREARDALTNAEKLQQLLARRPEIEEDPRATALEVKRRTVAFEHVDFSYEPGRQVLWDVSFRIEAGQTVAVVGGSGSGKSTLARLLLRTYDPQGGRVLIDERDIRQVTLASLRAAVGIVPQDSTLFNESVAYNIAYGRPGASITDVVHAARAAQIDELIASLPEQLETLVGERGLKLSGGEKQRIAIARAFLKNAPILILDEATSALDTRSEKAIQVQLDALASRRTTLVIAHRLSTIVDADRILVMDKGRIVEQGRHEELLAHRGLYAQLWDLQRQKQEFDRLARKLVRQPLNLGVLLASVVDELRRSLESRAVQLYTHLDPEPLRISGDPAVLSQAIWSICMQAIRATPRGGRIELRLERRGSQAHLSITDSRHQADSGAATTARQALPAAMDPLVLRSAIERQGGHLTITAPTSVQGMRFVIALPLRSPSAAAIRASTPLALQAPSDQRLHGMEVMVIDDREGVREAFDLALRSEGARMHGFASGEPALEWLQARPLAQWPSMLFCDISLGQEDGRQIMARIRELEERRGIALDKRIHAVALTTSDQANDRLLALMSGFQSHFPKSAAPADVVAAAAAQASRLPGVGEPRQHTS